MNISVSQTLPLGAVLQSCRIATLPVDKTSTVRASLEKKNGGLMDLHESRDCFRPSLDAASYMRISDRITFYGRIDYSYFKGKDIGAGVSIRWTPTTIRSIFSKAWTPRPERRL